jgi:hypothetical protein
MKANQMKEIEQGMLVLVFLEQGTQIQIIKGNRATLINHSRNLKLTVKEVAVVS